MDPWSPRNQQRVFRRLMEAFSRPGLIIRFEDGTENPAYPQADALLHVLASLADCEVDIADPDRLITDAELIRLGAGTTLPEQAHFVLADASRTPAFAPLLGTLESPEGGATLMLRVERLGSGPLELALTGPGIESETGLRVSGLHSAWIAARQEWNRSFPLGCEFILVDPCRVAALPRTVQVRMKNGT